MTYKGSTAAKKYLERWLSRHNYVFLDDYRRFKLYWCNFKDMIKLIVIVAILALIFDLVTNV